MIEQDVATVNVTTIEEEIEHKKIINKFQDWLICTMNNQVAEDSTSETCTANTRYKYTIDGLDHTSGLDPVRYFCTPYGYNDVDAMRDLYGSLLQNVQGFFPIYIAREKLKKLKTIKENNHTAVLDSMTGVVVENKINGCDWNEPLELDKCRFYHPLQINDRGVCV